MTLLILFGPHAVGKMTVGQALEARTGLRLFHNHMTIELVSHFFSYGSPEGKRLVALFRQEIFEAVAKSDLPGMIFTFMWALDDPNDWDYIARLDALFTAHGARVCYVELEAAYELRLERNHSENRLLHKPTKRNLEWSDAEFRRTEAKYRLNSLPGELPFANYMRLDNSRLSAEEASEIIQQYFHL